MFAVVTVKGKKLSLRGQAIMLYAVGAQLPKTPPEAPEPETGGSGVMAFFQIGRDGGIDKPTTWDGKPASTKTLAAIDDAHLKARIVGEGGWDQFVVGPVTTSQHIALESQLTLKPAEALQQQEAATRAAFPDAPGWLFAHAGALAAADNGISMGLCASDCKDKLSAWGVASGCSEDIRVRNLAACKNAHHAACQSVRPPAKGSLKVIGACAEEPGKCGEAKHDKSRCFLKQPIPGANAEERERWHIALPLRAKDNKGNYPYQGVLKVLVFNPVTGEGVVCSQEDCGPASTAFGSAAVDTLGIKADEFKGKPHVASVSYETAWKLGLNRNGQGDSVVMLAFVRASTPLGPIASDAKITLRKQATQAQLLGIEAVPEQLAPPPAPGADEQEESQSNGGKTKHVVPGPAPTPPAPKPPVPETRKLVPLRQKLVDAAKAELGKVDDCGPGGKRKGAEQLQKYLEHALGTTAAKEGWAEALKIPGQRPGGLRWSGHFTAYLAKHVGLKAGWDAANSVLQGVGAARYDQDYAPGDILVLKGQLQHHCVLIERLGDQLVTISGDGPYQTIEQRNRKPSEVTMYYRLSADTFAAK